MRYPSVNMIMQIKDVSRADALAIRAIMAGPHNDTRMERIDTILHTYGVEYIRAGRNAKSPAIAYCNAGDPYVTTILKVRGQFRVGCWGDIVERGAYD